jgi:hypothetical protein
MDSAEKILVDNSQQNMLLESREYNYFMHYMYNGRYLMNTCITMKNF